MGEPMSYYCPYHFKPLTEGSTTGFEDGWCEDCHAWYGADEALTEKMLDAQRAYDREKLAKWEKASARRVEA